MKKMIWMNRPGLAMAALIFLFVLMSVTSASAQTEERVDRFQKFGISKVTIREGQTVEFKLGLSAREMIEVENDSDLFGDLDLIAVDANGEEANFVTAVLEPFAKQVWDPFSLFDEDKVKRSLLIVEVRGRVSLRPRDEYAFEAYTVNAAFFSQLYPSWANDVMKPSSYKIKDAGCAMTSACMLLAGRMTNLNPKTLNAYLSKSTVGGYTAGGFLNWNKIPGFQSSSGVYYVGSSIYINGIKVSTIKSASTLKWLLDRGYYVIATSSRFPSHFVAIWRYVNDGTQISHFEYLDPADFGYVRRTVGDGKVSIGSGIRLFR